MARFSRKPSVTHPAEPHDAALESYLEAAEKRPGVLPWQEANVRTDLKVPFSLRIPEPLYLQLKWLSEVDKDSMHSICLEALKSEIAARLRKHNV